MVYDSGEETEDSKADPQDIEGDIGQPTSAALVRESSEMKYAQRGVLVRH